nr:MAG TPA: hypothetical protein [Caudoviricetes sp.]DAL70517.1 MAG TPA: hypothetical protein [Caudoviricetes sp.]
MDLVSEHSRFSHWSKNISWFVLRIDYGQPF